MDLRSRATTKAARLYEDPIERAKVWLDYLRDEEGKPARMRAAREDPIYQRYVVARQQLSAAKIVLGGYIHMTSAELADKIKVAEYAQEVFKGCLKELDQSQVWLSLTQDDRDELLKE
jgi:hypothetical protein